MTREPTARVVKRDMLVLETPEGVLLELPLAGPVSRFLAWLIDESLILTACSMLGKLLLVFNSVARDASAAIAILLYFVITVGYGIALEWHWSGQTVGKRVLGLRLIDASGGKLQFSQVAIRNLLRFLDSLPGLYLVGGAAMLLSLHSQRLGDLVANTVVLRRRPSGMPSLESLPAITEKYNSFLELPHLAARLRQKAGPALADLAYQALLRRDELEPDTRLQVFRELAAQFRDLQVFPEDLTAMLTPERYVRNALEVITAVGPLRARRKTISLYRRTSEPPA